MAKSPNYVLFKGKIEKKEKIKISPFLPSLFYAKGVFTTARIHKGRVFLLKEHLKRLKDSCFQINIPFPKYFDEVHIKSLLAKNKLKEGIFKAVITEDYDFVLLDKRILYPSHLYAQGVKVIVEKNYYQNETSFLSYIKTLNYLQRWFLREKAKSKGAEEILILNSKGFITECSMSNIFWIIKETIFTPEERTGLLAGITRNFLITRILPKLKELKLKEGEFTLDNLREAEEVFITNSLMGLLPVKVIEGIFFKAVKNYLIYPKLLKIYREYMALNINSDIAR